MAPLVGIIMGSNSDWETMRHAAETLEKLGVDHEVKVVSAHRTPKRLYDYASSAKERGLKIIIAGAGGAAHLPGMAASMTSLPVLGVPIESQALKGMDSLLSIVQMPAGVPVGTLAIGRAGAVNAGLLAASILATTDDATRGAGRALSRGADPSGGRNAGMIVRRARSSASSVAASSAGCWRWRRAQLGYKCHIFDPHERPCAARCRGEVHARALMTTWRRCETFGAQRRRRHLRVRESAGRAACACSATSCILASSRWRSRRIAPTKSVSSNRPARGSRRGARSQAWRMSARRWPSSGLPVVLKTRRYGYDGKGQAWIRSADETESAWEAIGGEPAVAEAGVDFAAEFSVIVARWADGRTTFWDSPDNIHRDGILRTSTVPSSPAVAAQVEEARKAAAAIAETLGHVGVLTVEFFASSGRAGRQRDRAARAQQRPLDHRGRLHLAVRTAHPRHLRSPARLDSARRIVGVDGQSDRRRDRTAGSDWSPTRAPTSTSTARARPGPAARWATSRD